MTTFYPPQARGLGRNPLLSERRLILQTGKRYTVKTAGHIIGGSEGITGDVLT